MLVVLVNKIGLAIAALAAAIYGATCLFLYHQQTRMIFFPSPTLDITPAEFGLSYEDVWLPVPQDPTVRLHGWWLPAGNEPSLTILYLHGNGVNMSANAGLASLFQQMGFSVFLIDYRGYGQSGGEFPNETMVYQDAEIAWNYLVQERQISPHQIVIFGHSLGGAVAIELATRQPDAAGLIVQSSFTSIRDMIDRTMNLGLFPVDLLLTQRFDSIRKVPSLQVPVLFIHGLEDAQTPADMTQALYQAAPDPKKLWLVPLAGHNNVADTAGMDYGRMVQQFVNHIEQLR